VPVAVVRLRSLLVPVAGILFPVSRVACFVSSQDNMLRSSELDPFTSRLLGPIWVTRPRICRRSQAQIPNTMEDHLVLFFVYPVAFRFLGFRWRSHPNQHTVVLLSLFHLCRWRSISKCYKTTYVSSVFCHCKLTPYLFIYSALCISIQRVQQLVLTLVLY
jgi:hypothetical protein